MIKTLFFCWIALLTAAFASAQEKASIIRRDTINLRGYIYNEEGKPIRNINLESTQLDPEYNQFKASAYTDTLGFFEIKGAIFNDTLRFRWGHATYYTPDFYNKDSRYVVIYLAPKVIDINSSNPVEVNHIRKYPKIIPSLNIKTFEGNVDYFEVHEPAVYPGGIIAFQNYLKNNLIYPETAIKNNAEGTVQIEFTVEKDGSLVNFKILRGIGYGCDQEVINLLKQSAKWRPAIDYGRAYTMKETVAVKFSLTDK